MAGGRHLGNAGLSIRDVRSVPDEISSNPQALHAVALNQVAWPDVERVDCLRGHVGELSTQKQEPLQPSPLESNESVEKGIFASG